MKFAPVGSFVYLSTSALQNEETAAEQHRAEGHTEVLARAFRAAFIGPYRVLSVEGKGQLNRKLQLPETLKLKLQHDVFHVDKLKEASLREKQFDLSEDLPPPSVKTDAEGDLNEDSEEEYHIERINAWRETRQGRWFHVKYRGYDDKYNQWQHEGNLQNAKEMVKNYLKNNPKPNTVSRVRRAGQTSDPTRRSRRRSNRPYTTAFCAVMYSEVHKPRPAEMFCISSPYKNDRSH